jgi:HlyD family secretion protein
MNLKKIIYISLSLVIILAIIFYVYNPLGQNRSSDSLTYRTVEVSRQDIGTTVFALGIIKPMVGAEVKVGSRISGVVNRLRANIGDYVEAGAVIAELDDAELRARLAQSRAALEKASVEDEQARRVYDRQRQLFENQHISEHEFDVAQSSYAAAHAQLMQAEANLALATIQLSYATIRSPISGVIASVSTQEGEAVAAGLAAPTFVNIIDLHRLEVHTYVDETDIGKIDVGQGASFTVDTYPGIEFPGKVTAIYPKAVIQDNVVNYIVTVEILDFRERILRPEMTANVTITLEERKDVLAVPTTAIHRDRGERYVLVLEGDRHVRRTVSVGWRDGAYTEILDGLRDGDLVLIAETI